MLATLATQAARYSRSALGTFLSSFGASTLAGATGSSTTISFSAWGTGTSGALQELTISAKVRDRVKVGFKNFILGFKSVSVISVIGLLFKMKYYKTTPRGLDLRG